MEEILLSKSEDIFRAAEKGRISHGDFLEEEEQLALSRYASRYDDSCGYMFWGGCEGTERKMLVAYPYGYYPDEEDLFKIVVPVMIKCSDYGCLTHRSCLGALLSLGIDKRVIGDIVILDDKTAILFTVESIADFITGDFPALERVGRDKVKTSIYKLPPEFKIEKKYETVTGTVPSARLDALISELARESRETAKKYIDSGMVKVNHSEVYKNDHSVESGDIISIRGSGRYRIESIGEITRKGRMRFTALKYV